LTSASFSFGCCRFDQQQNVEQNNLSLRRSQTLKTRERPSTPFDSKQIELSHATNETNELFPPRNVVKWRLQHQILYSRDISSKTQVIWFKQEWIRNNLLIHHIGTLRRNTVTDQTGLNRSFVKSTILHDALFNLLDSILIKVACSWHNLSSVTGKKICGLKRSFFRCIIFLTCHYIVFVLKQAVLSKSKHGGNNASIIGASSPSPNKQVLSDENQW